MKSIRYYYFTSIACILIASLLVLGLMQAYLSSTYFRREKENLLYQLIEGVAEEAGADKTVQNPQQRNTIQHMAKIAGAVVVITDMDGHIVFSTEPDSPQYQIPQQTMEKLQNQQVYKDVGRLGGFFSTKHYITAIPFTEPDGQISGYIFAASDTIGLSIYLSNIMSGFVLSAALVLLVAGMVALWLTNRMVVPIQRISSTARKFGEGDYSARVPVEGDNELAELAITFNEMANSFENTDISRRSFMGNIAHELRTPMTTIKGFVDGILDGTIPEEQRDKYLGIVSEEVGRLARLTKNMLDISRLEAGEYTSQTTQFDIWQPIITVFVSSQKNIEDKNIQVLGLQYEGPQNVMADQDFVHQILLNLVENAIKFTNFGGEISVKVKATRSTVTVSIRNTGKGIAEEALPHLFDRFYKADKSRGENAKGAGLGLHICKVLTTLMGGRIWAATKEGQWSEFSFSLPAAGNRKA